MRNSILLLAVVAIVVNSALVHSDQASTVRKNLVEPRLLKADKNEPFATRKLLRSQGVGDDEEDDSSDDSSERALPGVGKLAEVVSKFSGSQKLANQLWLKAREDPTNVFKKLKLHEGVLKLDDTPQLVQWLEYVQAYRNKMGSILKFTDLNVIVKLREVLPDTEVATLLQSLRQRPELKSFAEEAQTYLYRLWFNSNRYSPEDVAKMFVLKHGISALSEDKPAFKIVNEYTKWSREKSHLLQ